MAGMDFFCYDFGVMHKEFRSLEMREASTQKLCSTQQCWTVATFFTFGRSRMLGHKKLWPSAVACSEAVGSKTLKTYHKSHQ